MTLLMRIFIYFMYSILKVLKFLCIWQLAAVWPVLAPPDSECFRAVVLSTNQVASALLVIVTVTLVNVARVLLGAASPGELLPGGRVAGRLGVDRMVTWMFRA